MFAITPMFAMIVSVLCVIVFTLSVGMTLVTTSVRKKDSTRDMPNGIANGSTTVPVKRPSTPIAEGTTKPSPSDGRGQYLAEVAGAIAADPIAKSLFDNGSVVVLHCTEQETADDIAKELAGTLLDSQEKQGHGYTVITTVDQTREQTEVIRGNKVVVTINSSLFKEKEKKRRSSCLSLTDMTLKVMNNDEGSQCPPPTVFIVCMDDNAPNVDAERVDVCFIANNKQARLSIVNGSAQVFGRGSVTGRHSGKNVLHQIILHDETVCLSSVRCRIHAYDRSTVEVGIKCGVFLYGHAIARTDGKRANKVGRARYDQQGKLQVTEVHAESRRVQIYATKYGKKPDVLAAA